MLFGPLADDDVGEACDQGSRHNQGHGTELDAGQPLDAVWKPRGDGGPGQGLRGPPSRRSSSSSASSKGPRSSPSIISPISRDSLSASSSSVSMPVLISLKSSTDLPSA